MHRRHQREQEETQLQNLGESELRIWHPNGNKDHLYAASLNVQDPVLLVGSKRYLAISPQQIAGGRALKVWRAVLTPVAF